MRFLITCLLIYLGYRLIKLALPRVEKKEDVGGAQKDTNLDLKEEDVADATFEDIKDG